MASSRKFTKKQEVYDKPRKVLVSSYTTKSGQVKNRYKIDETAKIIKVIIHSKNHKRIS